jgi:hypothetical protein
LKCFIGVHSSFLHLRHPIRHNRERRRRGVFRARHKQKPLPVARRGVTHIRRHRAQFAQVKERAWRPGFDFSADLVCGGEPGGDLLRILNRSFDRQCARVHLCAHFFTFQQLFDNVWRAFVRTEIMDGQNVRMIERRCRPRFLFKPAQAFGVVRIWRATL